MVILSINTWKLTTDDDAVEDSGRVRGFGGAERTKLFVCYH